MLTDISLYDLLYCAPTLQVQLVLGALYAVFWYVAIPFIARRVTKPFLDAHPMREQFAKINHKNWTNFGIDVTAEEAYEMSIEPMGPLVQHVFGGLLCVPAVMALPGFSANLASALARHGALHEAGWELMDSLCRIWSMLFGDEKSRKSNPMALCIIMAVHHVMGLSMIIPMNLFYPELPLYHEIVMLLQLVAGAAMMCQNYGYITDASTRGGRWRMFANSTFVFIAMLWSRAFRFGVLAWRLLVIFNHESFDLFVVGSIAVGLMSLLNLLMVYDSTQKWIKFTSMLVRGEAREKICRASQHLGLFCLWTALPLLCAAVACSLADPNVLVWLQALRNWSLLFLSRLPGIRLSDVLLCAPHLDIQLLLVVIYGVFWHVVLRVFAGNVVRPCLDMHPIRQQYARINQKAQANFGIRVSLEEAYVLTSETDGFFLRHILGGLMCLPSVLGGLGLPSHVSAAFACHGALHEVGCEVQGTLSRVYDWIYGGDMCKKRTPKGLALVFAMHHVMGICLVIPMNLYFHDLSEYHELVFCLQFAAGVAMACQTWTALLDAASILEGRHMRASAAVVLATMLWSRLFRAYLILRLLAMFRLKSLPFFLIGVIATIFMSTINLLIIGDAFRKVLKFAIGMEPKGKSEGTPVDPVENLPPRTRSRRGGA